MTDENVRAALEQLSHRKVFFGHQSVGANILKGLAALSVKHGVNLPIFEWSSGPVAKPGFYHALNGHNEQPHSKIVQFALSMDNGLGTSVDFAFFKFCYVDISEQTNEGQLFDEYLTALQAVQLKYPHTTFIHVTAPLTVVQSGPRAWLKHLVGKSPFGTAANATRHRFNERLRREFCGKAPVFDLARIESTRMDGKLDTFLFNGQEVPRLVQDYTDDGQHLSEFGQQIVASQLALFLAELPAR